MKNIIKYIVIFFGLLFLSSFFVVDMTYGYVECYKPCSEFGCECGCQYASGCPYGCKQCNCPVSCSCGCINAYSKQCWWPSIPTCTCGYTNPSTCAYVCNPCSCSVSCVTSCNTTTGKCNCKSGCVTSGCNSDGSCKCDSDCPSDCESDGSCGGGGGTDCSVYTCDPGYSPIYDSSVDGCICIKNPGTCSTGTPCGGTTANPTCCPPGTYCGQTTSGSKICVQYDPPVPPSNTTPTAPTGLQTEGSTNPTTVSDTTPEFSAIFNDPNDGDSSVYYRIQVNTKSDFTGTVMWDSGKKSMTRTNKGSRSPQISYAGTALAQNGSTYYWRIKFWDAGDLESPWSSGSNWLRMKTNTAPTAPTQLQTEGTSNPQTVTDLTPEFSAIFNDPNDGDTSNYYQIQVNTKSDFTGTVMWNSNKTSMTSTSNGSRSPQISYAGTAFPQVGKKIYYWRIKFWDVGGLESPWSSGSPWFIMCINIDCDPTQYCEDAGWTSAPLTSESILLEDVVKCTAVINCQNVVKYGDCYEDPGIECTKDTDCDPGECCRAYVCTTDCTPPIECSKDSECGIGKCCERNECGECVTPDTQSLRVIMGSKISDTVVTSLWDRILAVLRKLNMYFY